MGFDLTIIFEAYLISLGLQFLAWPMMKMLFPKLPDSGWALGRVLTTLLVSLVIWQLGYLGIPENSSTKIWALLGLGVLFGLWQLYKHGIKSFTVPREVAKIICLEEYLFIVGFCIMAMIRAYAPSLDTLEKFMDFGFINQYFVSPTLPVADMWQAGQTINYYSFGHYWTSVIIKIWGVSPAVGYNLMLAFIFGSSLSLVFLICYLLIGKKNSRVASLGGLIGAFAVLVAGNSQVIWYFFKNWSLENYWYADATRFIHNTIHEFPSYSFVVSDLHGHLLDLPVILAFLVVLFYWLKNREIVYEAILGVLIGIMMMTNTWDVAVYGLVLFVLAIQMLIVNPREIKAILRASLIMILFVSLTALPWWLSFQSISNGVGVVAERSPLWQLAALWGGGIVVSVLAVILEGKGKNNLMIRTLAASAVILIIIPEFIFARDIYPNHPRANTMFKLTYQAFIMMGILMGVAVGKLIDGEQKMKWWARTIMIIVVSVIFGGTMMFPFKSFPAYYNGLNTFIGLNGEKWMEKKLPENYGAVLYLREHRDGKNMVEAVGDSYTLLNAVSAFSGVPTIEGWRVHEWLWRGGYGVVAEREAEVREIYQGEEIITTKNVLNKYNIGWILIGQDELITYKVNEEKLWQLGEVVWKLGDTYLIKTNY